MTTENIEPNRRRGRARTSGSETKLPEQRPFKQPRMKYAPTKVLSDDEIESIHLASLRILSDYGMDFLDADARNLLQKAGAKITDNRVRFDPEMVLETIKTCPSEFKLHSRNPDHTLNIGGDWMAFGSVGSTPNFIGFDGVRHPGTRKDYQDLLKLTQVFNVIHFLGGYPVEPIDLHASIRHIETSFDALTMTDKVLHCYSLGRQRNQDVLEMTRIARQVSHETLENEPSVFSVINSSSPLRLDTPMLQGIMEFSSRNQLIVMTPFTLAGAMAPITLAGALSQQNAEALAGMTFTQLVRPGAPVAYGGFTSNVDMQSGAPAFGTPEYMRTAMAGGQLARRYKVPYRSSNVCAANALDAQAAYESVFSLWGAIQGGVNFLMHGAGWMEGGLHSSLEKFVLDADLLGMVSAYLDPIVVDEATLAYEAIGEVGPGGHYFGVQHTQDRFRDAFHKPMISDWRNYESWQEGGSPTAVTKTTELAHKWLDSYETPTINAAALEELQEFRARRLAEGGVATDY
ncbi:MAG: trimethylamine methyltransferase family protein [Acidimicrobiaceae bacterium]|nr:trimethylamine methyltransferase family protein [Acidimicrobiaceae bacterium]